MSVVINGKMNGKIDTKLENAAVRPQKEGDKLAKAAIDKPQTLARHEELGLSKDDVMTMYYQLVLARSIDERIWTLNRQGKTAFVISCAGQEATQVGFARALRSGFDLLFPYYRDLAMVLGVGMTAREIMLHQLSKAEDPCSGGRQMPSHFASPRLNVFTVSSPIGTQLTQGAGAAYASKLKADGKVTLTSIGEGGTSKGDFHEALNFASVYKLPIVFLVENNGYAISVPMSKQMNIQNISDRAVGYGIPGYTIDGNDLLEVYAVAKEAVERARRGEGPTLVEAKTYRYRPHSSSDDDRAYRTREELEEWRSKDPIERFERYLEEQGFLDADGKKAMKTRVRQEIDAAQEYAEKAPYASADSVTKYVYAEEGEESR